jgi:4-hydroxythreonine-4-phosphate dehydrogenase
MSQVFAITMGDAAGIGPEIIAKAYAMAPELMHGCFVVGDRATLLQATRRLDCPTALPVALIENAQEVLILPPRCLPVLHIQELEGLVPYGQINAKSGRLAARCVVWAAQAALRGEIAGLITAPIHKQALAQAGSPFSGFAGHTELLQAEAARFLNISAADLPVRMMLANDELRVVLVSIHVALKQAIDSLNVPGVFKTIQIAHESLSRLLKRAPHIAVAGLNPHAGEGGQFGLEEINILLPAIAAARAQGIWVSEPIAPDTVFMRARSSPVRKGEFDVVIAMYHDQGLIPVKYLGVEKGFNMTLGLPLLRTSPDHGTAFDIAGLGQADPSSLIEAVRMARQYAPS